MDCSHPVPGSPVSGHAAGPSSIPFHRGEHGVVGVLAIQGSFALHLRCLKDLGVEGRAVRKPDDLQGLAGLVLPGGESTVMSLLMRKYGLFEPLRDLAAKGLPMFGTCAGAILLGDGEGPPPRLGVAPVRLLRNAYGTQIDSFSATLHLKPFDRPFHGVFIRAPKIVGLGNGIPGSGSHAAGPCALDEPEVLGSHAGSPVLVSIGNLLLATFHPELTDDLRVHRLFVEEFVRPSTAAVESALSR